MGSLAKVILEFHGPKLAIAKSKARHVESPLLRAWACFHPFEPFPIPDILKDEIALKGAFACEDGCRTVTQRLPLLFNSDLIEILVEGPKLFPVPNKNL